MNNQEPVRPQLKGGKIMDECGNPPGTIYFLETPIEWIKSKFFGKNQEQSTIEQEVEQSIVDEFPEPVLDCGDLEKQMFYCLCDMFNMKPKYLKRHFSEHWRGLKIYNEIVLGNFKFRQGCGFGVYVYDPTEPELLERILKISINVNSFKIDYTHGVWDKQFIKLISDLPEAKRIKKETEEQIKQERIQKMFSEEGVE